MIFERFNYSLLKSPLILVIFILIYVLCGGGMGPLGEAFFLTFCGLLVFISPPEKVLHRRFLWPILFLLAAFFSGFLLWPESWRAEWWLGAREIGIDLAPTLSVQPFITLHACVMLSAALLLFYRCLANPPDHKSRKIALWTLIFGTAVLSIIIIIAEELGVRHPFTPNAQVFSYFQNRNQTSIFLAMGAVSAFGMGVLGLKRRQRRSIAAFTCLLIILAAMARSLSKAGIFLFVIGIAFWILLNFGLYRKRMIKTLSLGVFAGILFFSIIVFSGGETINRLSQFIRDDSPDKLGARPLVYRDSLDLILDHPLMGIGAGNFEVIFPQYRNASVNVYRVKHPESDWFWLTTETGLFGLTAVILLVGAMVKSLHIRQRNHVASYRRVAATAFLIFLLHTFIDVSAHRPGTLLTAVLLFSLAVYTKRSVVETSSFSLTSRLLFRGLGIVFLFIGIMAIVSPNRVSIFYPQESLKLLSRSFSQVESNDPISPTTLEGIKVGLQGSPLSWRGHFLRALINLHVNQDADTAAADFRRARFLEPVLSTVAFKEGEAWIPFNHYRTLIAWREALERQTNDTTPLINRMVDYSSNYEILREGVRELSRLRSDIRIDYLRSIHQSELSEEIDYDAAAGDLDSFFSLQDLELFFLLWAKKGNPHSLIRFFSLHEPYRQIYWRAFAIASGRQGNYEDAARTYSKYVREPIMPVLNTEENMIKMLGDFRDHPTDILMGAALLQKQIQMEDFSGALVTCNRFILNKKVPVYILYWRARLLSKTEKWKEAYVAWQRYFTETNR